MSCKLFLAFALLLIPALAFVGLFGSHTPADDEGYSVGVVRSVADGVPLYTEQFDFHGPLPFLIKATLFRSLGIQITHQWMRIWVLAIWMLSWVCLTASIWQLTRNGLITAGGALVTGAHFFPLRFNPGHPEDFVALFLSVAILIASVQARWLSENVRVAMLGAIAGVLVATKINVGFFYLLGIALWMLASIPRRGPWKALSVLFTLAATITPLALMRSFLLPSWQLLLFSTVSILIACVAFFRLPTAGGNGWKQVLLAGGSAVASLAAILLFAHECGSNLRDMFDQTVLVAATHSSIIVRPVFTWICVPAVPLFLFVAYRQWNILRPRANSQSLGSLALLKAILAVAALAFAACLLFQFYIPLIGPICWLIVFPDGRTPIADRSRAARMFIASVAVFQVLQVFPIKGAQTAWSTIPLCVCCLVLLYDGLSESRCNPPVFRSSFSFRSSLSLCWPARC